MIFVTIGSLFPFDRLIRLVDEIAPDFPAEIFFAQIADGEYEPRNIPFTRMLSRREFSEKIAESKLIVAHAGMGSVISAMESNKRIVILPRIFEQGEHTTDHQMATARWLADKVGIYVAMDDAMLKSTIALALSESDLQISMAPTAPVEFLDRIRAYIDRI